MKKKLIILGLLLPIFLIGCTAQEEGSNNDPSQNQNDSTNNNNNGGEDTPVPVSSVSLNETSMEIYTSDTGVYLTATVLPEGATNKNVTWSSSDTSVATVNNGAITPLSSGTTTITVTTVDGNKTASCNLTVKEPVTIPNYVLHGLFYGDTTWTDKSMQQNPSSSSEYMIQGVKLYENDIFKIHMSGDTWYGYSDIKNSVSSGLVTRGTSDDNIKVLTTGTYDIYSSYNVSDGGHVYLAKVGGGSNPNPSTDTVSITGISLNRTGKYLLVRNEFQLEATVYPSNATNKNVTWTSSDTSIATVFSNGRVVAKEKRGTTIITAKTEDGNKTATCRIYVSPTEVPEYFLTGTINGRSYAYGQYTYAALPISTGKYLIPDVTLQKGDKLTVTSKTGAKLKNKYNQTYEYSIDKAMSVNIELNINADNYNYLTLTEK